MSKLEEALRKARADRESHVGIVRPVESTDDTDEYAIVDEKISRLDRTDEYAALEPAPGRDLVTIPEPSEREDVELADARVIFAGMDNAKVERVFRNLRTTIIKHSHGRNSIIMITSVIPGGGSSFVSINLAAAFALDESKTSIVLECDFSNRAFYTKFVPDNGLGMTDYLAHTGIEIEEIIHRTGIARVRIIPAGRQRESRAEYFTMGRAKRLLKDIKRRYKERYVILDAPPVTESADTEVLSEMCDFILLVVPYAAVSELEIAAAVKKLPREQFLGIVFNELPQASVSRARRKW